MIEEEEWSKEQEANRKPGQRYPTPSPGFADRVFYESLLQQLPQSKMAKKWCVEYGVLKASHAEKLCIELGISAKVATSKSVGKANVKKIKTESKGKKVTTSTKREIKNEILAAKDMEIGSIAYEGIGTTGL